MHKISTRGWINLVSPIIILIIGNLAAKLFYNALGKWAWIGYFPVYWSMLFLLIYFSGNNENRLLWFRKSQGSRWWAILAIGIGIISFPMLLIPNIHVMHSVLLVIAWFFFALINAPLEEAFWRGFLLD